MIAARYRHGGAINDGIIVVSGGIGTAGEPLASCEVCDTGSPGWAAAGAMSWTRYGHTLIQLPDGRVAAIGGLGRPADEPSAPIAAIAEVEIFDFSTRSWSSGGRLAEPCGLGACGYSAESVWVSGGGMTRTYRRATTGAWTRSVAGGLALSGSASYFGPTWAVSCGGATASNATKILIPNREIAQWRGIERFSKVASTSPNTFTIEEEDRSPSLSSWGSTKIRRSPGESERSGPHAFSPAFGMVAAGSAAILNQDVAAGAAYSTLAVVGTPPASPGWLAIDLGGPAEVGPIEYLGPAAAGFIRVKFVADRPVASGAAVSFLWAKGPYSDSSSGKIYSAPSDAPTAEAAGLMLSMSGGGLPRSVSIRYPSDAGMGGEGYPTVGDGKLSDSTAVWSGK